MQPAPRLLHHKQLRRARLSLVQLDRPELSVDRAAALEHAIRSAPSLNAYLFEVEAEVRQLEAAARALPKSAHRDPRAIRAALELLRGFGRIAALDFERLLPSARTQVVRLLALEYRWCFAAASTTPEAFKRAIGRMGTR